ncbi:MAG: GNAT family N-acetyltransferase [Kosmotogaceae bacterium]|nr:GNAT family N-acetyltransferase [Kosmotogaceae bacterium]
MLKIVRVNSGQDRKEFTDLPKRLYRDYPLWVPPFSHEIKAVLKSKGSQLLANGPHDFFIAKDDNEVKGRIAVGIEEVMNNKKSVKHAYFTLFESVDDKGVAEALLRTAESWARNKGMNYLKGPVSPTNGDDYRGLLVDSFDDPPAVLMPYNPSYYASFFENFEIYLKYLAFKYDLAHVMSERETKFTEIAMNRYKFHVEEANFGRIKEVSADLQKIMEESIPNWEEDILPPTYDELYDMAKTLKLVADRRMVIIARSGERPIGFFVALPDFSPIIREIGGRLLPFGWYKFLRLRKSLERARAAILFVVPDFRNKGVPSAMFLRAYRNIQNMGFKEIEGSSISSMNSTMIANARRAGGREYKHYIVYGKSLLKRPLSLTEIYGPAASRFAPKDPQKFESVLEMI